MSSSSPPTPPTPPPPPTPLTPPAPADWSPIIAAPPPALPFVNYSPGGSDLNYTPGPRSPAPPPPANAPLGDSSSLSSSSSAASSQQTQQDQDVYRGPGAYPPTEVFGGIPVQQSPPASASYLVPSQQTGDAYNAGQSNNPPPSQPPPVAAPTPQGAPPTAAAVVPPALAGVTAETAGAAAAAADAAAAAQAAAAAGWAAESGAGSATTVLTDVLIVTELPATTLVTPAVPAATGITGGALAVEGALAIVPPVAIGLAVTGAVVGAYYGIPALARAIEADKLSPDYPSAGLPGPVDPIPMALPGGVGGGAPMTDPAAGTGPAEILPGGTPDPQPQVAPGTGGPAVSAVGWQYWQAVLGRSGLTVDPVTGEPKEVSGVLHVDHIVARSRIELYLEVTYPSLTLEQIAAIANMEENLQNLEGSLNTQKGPLSYQEWNDMRIANDDPDDPPLDPGYLAEMQEIEDRIWELVDEQAQQATYGLGGY
jgi:hypothetical protein